MISTKMLCFWMTQQRLISQGNRESSPLRSELSLDFKETIQSTILDHSTSHMKSQFIIQVKSLLSGGEEDKLSKIKPRLQAVQGLEDTCQRLVQSHLTNRISLDGLYLKLEGRRMRDSDQIEIRLTTPDQHLVSKVTPKIELDSFVISDLPEELSPTSQVFSTT